MTLKVNGKSSLEEHMEEKSNYNRNLKKKGSENYESTNHLLNIWERSPSFNDVNSNLTSIKVGVIGGIITGIILLTFLVFENPLLSVLAGTSSLFLFMVAFYDQLFSLRHFISFKLCAVSKIDPFEDLKFWMMDSKPDTLFYTNIKDKMTVGMKIFKVNIIAENVDPNLDVFFKSLSNDDIPFTYQIIQQPLNSSLSPQDSTLMKMNKSSGSIRTIIYFCVYYHVKGMSNTKIGYLVEVVDLFAKALDNSFKANYRHFKIKLLKEEKLINSFRTMYTRTEISSDTTDKACFSPYTTKFALKSLYITLFSIYSLFLFTILGVNYLISIPIIFGIFLLFMVLFWRDLFFMFSRISINRQEIQLVNPFYNVSFQYYRRFPDTLFTIIEGKLMIATKIFNLSHVIPPFFDSRQNPIAKMGKFIETIVGQLVPASFTHVMSPIRFYRLEKYAWDLLLERIQRQAVIAEDEKERARFMKYRFGIWRTIMLMSIHVYKQVKSYKLEYLSELKDELNDKETIARIALRENLDTHHGVMLIGNKLISGLVVECLKNKFYRMNGTHLHYLMLQGAYLAKLIEIYPDFTKGIRTKIASEFNTPLPIENYITIGHSINTEFYKKETEAGFRKDQIGDILITGGSNDLREMLMMKIVMELIKERIPSIVFDYSGKWSKLLNYFKDTRYEDTILLFILGKSFTLNLMKSDISYDQNNVDYIKYMIDVLSLAFQKEDRAMETFKTLLLKQDPDLEGEMDLTFLAEDLKNEAPWKKDFKSDPITTLLNDFSTQDMGRQFFSHDPDETITVQDFVQDDCTVIIDLSQLKDLRKKIFAAFIIIAKIIHRIESDKHYIEKIFFIPNLDIVFNEQFLKTTMNYGKIDKFCEPLFKARFGLVASTEEISSLHPHVYTYFSNYITFKTTENYDTSKLIKLMNFRTLHGEGIYGKNRKDAYQLNYLTNLESNEIIIKRSDIEQPFPLKLDMKNIINTPKMTYTEIVAFMQEHGYDFTNSEKRIIEKARKTIFKKDFDNYFTFIDEIINFMEGVKKVDKIGNNYKTKLKEELLRFITPRAIKILGTDKKKRDIMTFRNDIFHVLLRHGYLVENHPHQASGSESIRTSYSVGHQYEKALKDYYESKKNKNDEYFTENVEGIIDAEISKKSIMSASNKNKIEAPELLLWLTREVGSLFQAIFELHRYMKSKNYIDAQNLCRDLLPEFFDRMYRDLHDTEINPSNDQINSFITSITSLEGFPLSYESLEKLLMQCKNIGVSDEHVHLKVLTLYDELYDFYMVLKKYLSNHADVR